MTATLRAAIYLRVSLDQTGERLTVTRHRADAEALAARRGWTVADDAVFTDNSISASGKKKRPEFTAMLDRIKRGDFDVLIAWEVSRLGRNARERIELAETCKEAGVVIALVKGSDMDPRTASGRLVFDILGSVAEAEIAIKAERQRSAARQRASKGRPPLGTKLTGYTASGEVVEAEAEAVRRIFKMFMMGESLKSIARALTDSGATTARNGKPWNPTTVRGILANPRYAGRAIYMGKVVEGTRGNWEPLVSDDVFDLVQAKLNDPARHSGRVGTYLGAGLYLCATCDEPVVSHSAGRYRCRSARKSDAAGEAHMNRSHEPVDKFVCDVIAGWLRRDRDEIAAALAPAEANLAPLLAEIERLRTRIATIDADYDAGYIDGLRRHSAVQNARGELIGIERQLASHTTGAALGEVLGSEDPAKAFLDAGLMTQRGVVDALVTVKLRKGTRGSKVFDPETVAIDWKVKTAEDSVPIGELREILTGFSDSDPLAPAS
jgi:site-specific DNA recombinase